MKLKQIVVTLPLVEGLKMAINYVSGYSQYIVSTHKEIIDRIGSIDDPKLLEKILQELLEEDWALCPNDNKTDTVPFNYYKDEDVPEYVSHFVGIFGDIKEFNLSVCFCWHPGHPEEEEVSIITSYSEEIENLLKKIKEESK